VSRAPGRINLIGEHTDYNGLPVLPMAIRRAVRVFLAPRDDSVLRVANLNPEYEPVEFLPAADAAPGPEGSWGNYVMAPAVELSRRFGALRGMDALVTSDLPVAAGLSSSSALVIALGLALARLNELPLDDLALAAAMADAERFTGTRGGGMDQAISLCAVEGHATRIDFEPLRLAPVPLPSDWRFVVAHSMSRAEKSGAARAAYNARGMECGRALRAVAAVVAADRGDESPAGSYAELLAWAGDIEELLERAETVLDPVHLRRFRHVVTEARRVDRAQAAMLRGDMESFGRHMTASHESLRVDYEVSSVALDELVFMARERGAAGARLTGAGFGGCVIALCSEAEVPGLVAALDTFYRRRAVPPPHAHLFVAESSGGAGLWARLPPT
jgi:galactokinase